MDTPTKQRLVGAAVLIALAVIFLPMLVKGPAPDSGVSDVPLDIPNQPPSGMETRDLPLVSPQAGDEGALATPAPPAGERLPTVDTADAGWQGRVGVVPKLVERAPFDPASAVALVCGPEVMMRFAVAALRSRGVGDDRVYVSMERNMQCGIGHCGHCQLGPSLVCRDGPVYRYEELAPWLAIPEL